MTAAVDVKTRDEATALKTAMEDPVMKAYVITVGFLKQLPSDRARQRVLSYVKDWMDENKEAAGEAGS